MSNEVDWRLAVEGEHPPLYVELHRHILPVPARFTGRKQLPAKEVNDWRCDRRFAVGYDDTGLMYLLWYEGGFKYIEVVG